MNKKTNYTNEFKFKIAIEAIRGDKTIAQLVQEHNVASSLISKWKKQVLESGASLFGSSSKPPSAPCSNEKKLYEQLGRQAIEIDYLKQFAGRYR
jgi:transposase-like protein